MSITDSDKTDNHFIVKCKAYYTDILAEPCGVELAGWHDNDGVDQKIAAQ